MGSFALSPAAYLDLEDVDTYTLSTWGEAQRDRYIHALFERFSQVSAMPTIG
jgi:plasmid stabilization system protein ParE